MDKLDRRCFLRSTALIGGSLLGFEALIARGAMAQMGDARGLDRSGRAAGFGELFPRLPVNADAPLLAAIGSLPDYRGQALLALPGGFRYTAIGRRGTPMSDGRITPGSHDGQAAFADADGRIRIVRNHEQGGGSATTVAFGTKPYDPSAAGGTTTLVVDPETRLLEQSFASLSGTIRNCAGGQTPWGTWISSEETTLAPAGGNTLRERHGYNFEVPLRGEAEPIPLTAMGRFSHEAVAVDPATGIVYETEDAGSTSGFYRFIPAVPGRLALGGRLQMLAVKHQPQYDTRTGQRPGRQLLCTWVDIPDPDPATITPTTSVFAQGFAAGGARFARLEGAWYGGGDGGSGFGSGGGSIFFDSTSGGNAGQGQIWEYRPVGDDQGFLTLIFESPDAAVLNAPDNLCVSPGGGLILCEDGSGEEFVHGLTPRGRIFRLAKNTVPGQEGSEFAGATFSLDGRTLFVNVQGPGLTFAIWPDTAGGRNWADGGL